MSTMTDDQPKCGIERSTDLGAALDELILESRKRVRAEVRVAQLEQVLREHGIEVPQ